MTPRLLSHSADKKPQTALSDAVAGVVGGPQRWAERIETWLATHNGDDYPGCLDKAVARFERQVGNGPKDPRSAMLDALMRAAQDVGAQGYPARRADEVLRGLWCAKIAGPALRRHHDEAEFDAMLSWAIGWAQSDDRRARRARMRRALAEPTEGTRS